MRKGLLLQRVSSFDWMLQITALVVACVQAVSAPGWGDYADDAKPGLMAIAHGNLAGFFSHQPAMGAFAQLIRVPFVMVAGALHDSPMGIYKWGDLPCLLSIALVAGWAARIAGRRGTGRPGQLVIVALCMFNPLVTNALLLGHPEELLTASLAVGSLLACSERRFVLAAVLVGLSIATKQWAAVLVCPVLLAAERERIRAGLLMFGSAAVATLPMVIGNFHAFRYALTYISKAGTVTTDINWFYPLTSRGRTMIYDIFGPPREVVAHTVPAALSSVAHPAIIAVSVVVPVVVWWCSDRRLDNRQLLLVSALVLLLRCTLDPESAPYYHLALMLCLVALDADAGRRIPLAGIVGFAGAFTILDRFLLYLSLDAANTIYMLATVAAAAVLAERLYSRPERGLDRLVRGRDRVSEPLGLAPAGPR